MAGHSKWSKVKRAKGALDVKRGTIFSKFSKEISVAARLGGGDPAGNPRLRSVIEMARAQSMPNDNIERAFKRGTGEGVDAQHFEEIVYEGYGPGGVAILVEAATDNRNRTAADVRSLFAKAGGQLAGAGAVAWQFEPLGVVAIQRDGQDPDEVALAAIDAGAEDVDTEGDPIEVMTTPGALEAVRKAIEQAGYTVESAEVSMQPKQTVELDAAHARQNLRLIDHLEDHDDVQRVTANFEIPDEVLAEAASA